MNKLLLVLCILIAAGVGVIAGQFVNVVEKADGVHVEMYWTYPGTGNFMEDNPEQLLVGIFDYLAQLHDNSVTAYIAVYTFTDNNLRDAVLRAFANHDSAIGVRILTEDSTACNDGSDIDALYDAGIPVRVDKASGLMHHKFVVFDTINGISSRDPVPYPLDNAVITGSYNWSDAADTRNFENLVLLQHYTVYFDFLENFLRMWDEAGPFDGC